MKKENYDSCDALICALAYSNQKRHGELDAKITKYWVLPSDDVNATEISYTVSVWDRTYNKKLIIPNPSEPQGSNSEQV